MAEGSGRAKLRARKSFGRPASLYKEPLLRSKALLTLGGLLLAFAGCPTITPADVCAGRTCSGNFVCNTTTGVCEPPVGPDPTRCAGDGDCGGGKPRCDLSAATCVECLGDGDCGGGNCTDKACVPLPDSCATQGAAVALQSSAKLEGDTTAARHDTTLACALPGASGRDVVYALSVSARKRLVAVARPKSGSGLLPVLGLRTACESTAAADLVGCAAPPAVGGETRLVVDPLLPGTYHLWVDGEAGTFGAFTVELSLEETTAGESCAAPIYLPLNKPSLTVTGETAAMADDAAGTCGGSGGNDGLYAVQLSAPRRVAFEVTTATSGYSPLLYLRSACDDGAVAKQLACAGGAGTSARVDLPRLEPGTYFLWVDGQANKAGTYVLKIDASDPLPPPTHDGCATAEVLPLPAGGVGTVVRQSDTGQAKGDALGCGATGNDLVYSITTTAPSALEVKVTPFPGSSLKPVVYLRAAGRCASEALMDQFACAQAATAGGAATLSIPHLPAGSWSLWVDGAAGSAGPFELVADFKPPAVAPGNDTCSAPTSVALAGAPVTVLGSTWGATDQHSGCELPQGSWSPDIVYSLVLNTRQSLGVELRADPGSALKPVLSLLAPTTCTSNLWSDVVTCGWGDPQLSDRMLLTIPVLEPGVYPLWVEGDEGSQGAFSLRLSPGPPMDSAPANDACSLPQVLTPGVTLTGDTRAAGNDSSGSCGLPYDANGEHAPDVVYKFVLASAQTVGLTVTPDATAGQLFRPVVYVEGPGTLSCSGGGAVKGCQLAQAYGGAVTVSMPNLAAGTYYVWVDGAGLSGGKFTIRWQ